MFSRYIDISVPIENSAHSDPAPFLPKITYIDHHESFKELAPFFPGLKKEDLPDGEAWANERLELITHNGTHLDAPYHYASTMDQGKKALTIDQIPLDWCFRPGVKLDFRHFSDGYVVTQEDVRNELLRLDYTISPYDIVLINTRAGSCYGTEGYLRAGCGMSREATLFLLEQEVKVTGTDAWSWDAPFIYTAERYQANCDPSIIWEGHKAGREKAFCHLEKLQNLEVLPDYGFMVCCFPVKIKDAGAAWTRAVALLP